MIIFTKNKIFDLKKEQKIEIGRNKINKININDEYVSGHHGYFFLKDSSFFYQDNNSANGTLIDIESKKHMLNSTSFELSKPGKIIIGKNNDINIWFVPGSSPFEEGIRLIKTKKFQIAHLLFEALINSDENEDPDIFYYSSVSASKKGYLDTAITRMAQYCILRPHDHEKKVELAKLYIISGKPEKALEIFDCLMANFPEFYKRCKDIHAELKQFSIPGIDNPLLKKTREYIPDSSEFYVTLNNIYIKGRVNIHGRIITDVAKSFVAARESLGQKFNFLPDSKLTVHLVSLAQGIKSNCCGNLITLALEADILEERPFIDVVVKHEYTHYILNNLTKTNIRLPWWWHEGLAQLFSIKITPSKRKYLKSALRAVSETNTILDILERHPLNNMPFYTLNNYYLISHAAAEIIYKKTGISGINTIINDFNLTNNMKKTLKNFGITYQDILAEIFEN